eukprot:scaffold12866_cov167-Isochrysis_galbana.AAC.2
MLVAGATDMQLDLTAWSADVLAIQGPEFAEMQHLWRSPKAAADPGWWRRSSQLKMIIKNLPEKELLRCGEALSVLRPHVQPSANDIVRYRRGLKDKKLTGPLDSLSAGGTRAPAGGGRACREPAPPQRGRPRSPTWSPAHETCERTSSAESAGGEDDGHKYKYMSQHSQR